MTDLKDRTGGCLCGKIRYTAPSAPLAIAACHCRDCQRAGGGALSLLAIFPRNAVAIEGTLSCYEGQGDSGNKVQRYFCGGCGSPIYSDTSVTLERGIMLIKAGSLDDVGDLIPRSHVWVASKQPWLILPEGAIVSEQG